MWFTEAGPPERSAVIEHFYRPSLATVQRSAHSRGALGTPRGRHQRRQRRSQDHRAKSASIDPQRNRGSWAVRRESRMSCEIAAFARSGQVDFPVSAGDVVGVDTPGGGGFGG
jgi:N-methylhydantoinase B/oxoprolinase/acetone carboxylase alpha subunit